MTEGLISSKAVAAMLGISHFTFSDWRTNRKRPVPPCYVINGRPRYIRSEVEEWIKQHRFIRD